VASKVEFLEEITEENLAYWRNLTREGRIRLREVEETLEAEETQHLAAHLPAHLQYQLIRQPPSSRRRRCLDWQIYHPAPVQRPPAPVYPRDFIGPHPRNIFEETSSKPEPTLDTPSAPLPPVNPPEFVQLDLPACAESDITSPTPEHKDPDTPSSESPLSKLYWDHLTRSPNY
jgi:hypothetical protein